MKENNLVKKSNEGLEYLSGDDEARRLAELRLKYKREMASMKSDEIEIATKNIAIKMLKRGMEKNIISEITELSITEIDKLEMED
ncbi:MAG: hypothetical protein IJX34_05125 [Clostridia bacterium]|nr:hypothetical protein [Clostridia bacterium]